MRFVRRKLVRFFCQLGRFIRLRKMVRIQTRQSNESWERVCIYREQLLVGFSSTIELLQAFANSCKLHQYGSGLASLKESGERGGCLVVAVGNDIQLSEQHVRRF